MTKEKSKDYKVPALEKGLDILETLSAAPDPMSLTDLSRALDRNPSELYRMIGFLEKRGYIIREAHSGNYHLTLKLFELAHTYSPVDQLIRAAAAPMRELAMSVRESCHLSMLSGDELVVVYQQDSPEKVRFSVEVGARFDPVKTVSGRLLLAYLEPQEREQYLERHPELQEGKEKHAVIRKLDEVLKLGYSTSARETHLGIRDTAVLAGNPRIGLSAALCIPSLIISSKQDFDESIVQALKQCASQMTKAMGVSHV